MDAQQIRLEALRLAHDPRKGLAAVRDRATYYADIISGHSQRDREKKVIKDRLIEAAAQAAHEAIRTLQIENKEPNVAKPWNTVSTDIYESCLIGVQRVIDNPSITDEALHDSWVETKRSQGWVYGEVRSDEQKHHPCMVPYNELPAYQRLKDALFRNIVKAVLNL